MAGEVILVTIEQMADLRGKAGQSEKRIANSAQEFIAIPLEGTFSHIGTKEFDIPKVGKRTSLGLFTVNGEFVSENALNAQELLSELSQIKSTTSKRKDKFCLKSNRLSDLSKFGASADKRLVAMQGKTFTAVPKQDCLVYKSEYLDELKFDEVCSSANSAQALKDALKKTETKKLYIFDVVK